MGCGIQKSILRVDPTFKVVKKISTYTKRSHVKKHLKTSCALDSISEVPSELELSKAEQ